MKQDKGEERPIDTLPAIPRLPLMSLDSEGISSTPRYLNVFSCQNPPASLCLISWLPSEAPQGAVSLLCIGGYELVDAAAQLKSGSLTLLWVLKDDSSECGYNFSVSDVSSSGAIFDLRFDEASGILWSAQACGAVETRKIKQGKFIKENQIFKWQGDFAQGALSIGLFKSSLVVSGSKGGVALLEHSGELVSQWAPHTLECWTARVGHPLVPELVFSGSDDSLLVAVDPRISFKSLADAALVNRKHSAGVTAIEFIEERPNSLLTGCYDGRIRLFDLRQSGRSLASFEAGDLRLPNSGIWRIEKRIEKKQQFAIAGMHAGAFVVSLSGDILSSVCSPFHSFSSLIYGCLEVSPGLLLSSSFYEKEMKLWAFE